MKNVIQTPPGEAPQFGIVDHYLGILVDGISVSEEERIVRELIRGYTPESGPPLADFLVRADDDERGLYGSLVYVRCCVKDSFIKDAGDYLHYMMGYLVSFLDLVDAHAHVTTGLFSVEAVLIAKGENSLVFPTKFLFERR